MLAGDISQDAARYLGLCAGDSEVFNKLSFALELLAQKGPWNSLEAYLDIVVGSGNVVTLPDFVLVPIRLNINGSPSFSRSKLYQFSLDGPGNDMQDTAGYSWSDQGEVPTLSTINPAAPERLTVTNINTLDNGKSITIYGRDSTGTYQISDTLILNHSSPPLTTNTYAYIDRVEKDLTIGDVTLKTQTLITLSIYRPTETEPQYKQIRLTKSAAAVRMLYRMKTDSVTSDSDYIPLRSRQAVLMMCRALRAYESDNPDAITKGQAFEDKAVSYHKEEQTARTNFDLVKTSESQPALDLNYNNADSIIVGDIIDDAIDIFGPIGRNNTYDKITESVEMLNRKGIWNGLEGYVDILTDQNHYISLPRYVDSIISMNINGEPKIMRNKWFEFHLNGPGSKSGYCRAWDEVPGGACTSHSLSVASQFIYQPDSSTDNGKTIRIYGWDENHKEIIGGFLVTADSTGALPNINAQKCTKIDRITRDETVGYCKLIAYDPVLSNSIQIGYYYPDETEPRYQRIKIYQRCAWLRIAYRKRMLKVSSLTDPIHLKSKLAVVLAMKSLKSLMDGKFQDSQAYEAKAEQMLIEEQNSRSPGESFNLQISADRTVVVL